MTKDELNAILARNPQVSTDDHQTSRQVQDTKPKRHQKAALVQAVPREAESLERAIVRFIGYRIRCCDPDNFAGSCKDLLDGLRHASFIPGDEPWRIIFQTEQVKVSKKSEERTEIEITRENFPCTDH